MKELVAVIDQLLQILFFNLFGPGTRSRFKEETIAKHPLGFMYFVHWPLEPVPDLAQHGLKLTLIMESSILVADFKDLAWSSDADRF
jgi:hypothetical protein